MAEIPDGALLIRDTTGFLPGRVGVREYAAQEEGSVPLLFMAKWIS